MTIEPVASWQPSPWVVRVWNRIAVWPHLSLRPVSEDCFVLVSPGRIQSGAVDDVGHR